VAALLLRAPKRRRRVARGRRLTNITVLRAQSSSPRHGVAKGAGTKDGAPGRAERTPDEGEGTVNMRKPLIGQIPSLSHDEYLHWVHDGHFYTQDPKYSRFFGPDWMEVFSMTYWWVVPMVWVPIAAGFVLHGSALLSEPLWRTATLFATGVATWTAVEYTLHRFVFHLDEYVPNHPWARTLHFLLHGVHHKIPMDPFRLVMPPVLAAAIAVPTYLALRFVYSFLSTPDFHVLFGGLLIGYTAYDCLHYAFHHSSLEHVAHLAFLKKHHMKHHFLEGRSKGFGIVTTFWDHVFGTVLDVSGPHDKRADKLSDAH
jgi:sterol desaturase/sphingolipid hydroxylase (fatty acid hydroxylase superfamily)